MTGQTTSASPATPPDVVEDPLQPLRSALLAAAERDAQVEVAAAEEEHRRLLAEARSEAGRLRAQARAEGERDAEQLRVEQRARARRRARATVLAEQRRALDDLHREVANRLSRLWTDPATRDAIRDRLVATARADLGAQVSVHDLPEGGVVAAADHVRATYRLTDLADQVIASTGSELAGLWTP